MRFACCITKATDTHSEYVILIALPWQYWLREHATVLRLYVHCDCCFDVGTKYVHTLRRQEVRFLSGKLVLYEVTTRREV